MSFINIPWLLLITQLFHGLTFSAMWVAGVSYANQSAPPGLGATAQGLFNGVYMGIGSATGAMIGGILYQEFGGAIMYRYMSIFVTASVILFLILQRIFNPEKTIQIPRNI